MIANTFANIWDFFGKLFGFSGKKNTAAVCVGMERSSKFGACPGAFVDSNYMHSILKRYGSTTLLQNGVATKAAVVAALEQALKKKLCIFYYSGHGGQEANVNGEKGVSEFLCLNDGPLHDYEIWQLVQKAEGRVFMIFDCCHSGTMFRSAGEPDELNEPDKPAGFHNTGFSFQMLWKQATHAKNVNLLVWAGCPAEDLSYGNAEGGVFTNGIKIGYGRKKTYNEVWNTAKYYAKDQRPVCTRLGVGFLGKIFR